MAHVQNEKYLSLFEHLEELRKRLLRVVILGLILFSASLFFQDLLMSFVTYPHRQAMAALHNNDSRLTILRYEEGIMGYLKTCFIASLFILIPYALLEVWGFIRPALSKKSQHLVSTLLTLSFLLFILGVLLGYFYLIPFCLTFLAGFSQQVFHTQITLSSYLSLFFGLTLALGLAFQIPIAIVVLHKIGILSQRALLSSWRIVVLVAFILGGVLTPTVDPITQTLVALPLIGLYFFGWLLTRLL